MKKIEFDTRSEDGSIPHRKGYFALLPGYERYLFGIYRASNIINSATRWIIVELSTGLAVGGNNWQKGQTRTKAIEEAKEILDRVGKLSLDKHIQENLDKQTISGKLNKNIT